MVESCLTYVLVVWCTTLNTLGCPVDVDMSHVARVKESCRTCGWVMLHVWMRHVAHVNESCRTCEGVMSYMWMSHVINVDVSWHTYKLGVEYTPNALECPIESCRTCEWVTSHTETAGRSAPWIHSQRALERIHEYPLRVCEEMGEGEEGDMCCCLGEEKIGRRASVCMCVCGGGGGCLWRVGTGGSCELRAWESDSIPISEFPASCVHAVRERTRARAVCVWYVCVCVWERECVCVCACVCACALVCVRVRVRRTQGTFWNTNAVMIWNFDSGRYVESLGTRCRRVII